MRRQHPLSTTIGYLFTAVMMIGLGLMVLRSGGEAFSPGRLSAKSLPGVTLQGFASHADFEGQCSHCHKPLQTTQDMLCTACHTDITAQIEKQNGTHGHISNVKYCANCHADHQGTDFDPTLASFSKFDHSQTNFSLTWHQVNYDATPMDCKACHNLDTTFTVSISSCTLCHGKKDPAFMVQHQKDFGQNCVVCHDGQDRMIHFDHQTTAFPLEGKHQQARCADCHGIDKQTAAQKASEQLVSNTAVGTKPAADPFKGTPTDCAKCHAEPETHRGSFSSDCASCHTAAGWTPAKLDGKLFNHTTQLTGFSLALHQKDYSGQTISCSTCHQSDVHNLDVQTCIACHSQGDERAAFMSKHIDQFGPACLDCHDGVDRLSNFDHANFFPLDGSHASLQCEDCHANKVFRGTPTACVQCHAEPDIHKGFFGLQCNYCHTTQAWAPARLLMHNFPLDHGGQGQLDCKVCHQDRYVEYTCYGCHDHQPDPIAESHIRAGISLEELPNCAKCHPSGVVENSITRP